MSAPASTSPHPGGAAAFGRRAAVVAVVEGREAGAVAREQPRAAQGRPGLGVEQQVVDADSGRRFCPGRAAGEGVARQVFDAAGRGPHGSRGAGRPCRPARRWPVAPLGARAEWVSTRSRITRPPARAARSSGCGCRRAAARKAVFVEAVASSRRRRTRTGLPLSARTSSAVPASAGRHRPGGGNGLVMDRLVRIGRWTFSVTNRGSELGIRWRRFIQ